VDALPVDHGGLSRPQRATGEGVWSLGAGAWSLIPPPTPSEGVRGEGGLG
jgi:hypothetical protein